MRTSRIVALVIGCLMLLPGLGLLFGGGALGLAYAAGRNESGYFEATLADLRTPTAAITAETPALTADLQTSTWFIDVLDTDLRLQVTSASSDTPVFVGIGPAVGVDAYLAGVAHDEIVGMVNGGTPVYRTTPGTAPSTPPADQSFWVATATGVSSQQLNWQPSNGRWAAVIMNADGSPGVAAAATVEVRAGFLLPLSVALLILGIGITAAAVALIVIGATGGRTGTGDGTDTGSPDWSTGPGPVSAGGTVVTTADHPVALTAHLDPGLTRWMWLVKWFLAIPHYIVLAFLWPAFLVVTVIAGFCILFTGVYPRPLFEFTSGVLRWTWRVSYYAASGGIGTDQYPPFTLGYAPQYPARLDIAYPATLSRGLVLVKWWLLALPHYLIIAFFVTNWWGWTSTAGERFTIGPVGTGGLLGLLVVIAGIVLLFTAKYPQGLFGLIVGLNRWIYRVIAYAALMTDQYPPFRLDQGGPDPTTPAPDLPTGVPARTTLPTS